MAPSTTPPPLSPNNFCLVDYQNLPPWPALAFESAAALEQHGLERSLTWLELQSLWSVVLTNSKNSEQETTGTRKKPLFVAFCLPQDQPTNAELLPPPVQVRRSTTAGGLYQGAALLDKVTDLCVTMHTDKQKYEADVCQIWATLLQDWMQRLHRVVDPTNAASTSWPDFRALFLGNQEQESSSSSCTPVMTTTMTTTSPPSKQDDPTPVHPRNLQAAFDKSTENLAPICVNDPLDVALAKLNYVGWTTDCTLPQSETLVHVRPGHVLQGGTLGVDYYDHAGIVQYLQDTHGWKGLHQPVEPPTPLMEKVAARAALSLSSSSKHRHQTPTAKQTPKTTPKAAAVNKKTKKSLKSSKNKTSVSSSSPLAIKAKNTSVKPPLRRSPPRGRGCRRSTTTKYDASYQGACNNETDEFYQFRNLFPLLKEHGWFSRKAPAKYIDKNWIYCRPHFSLKNSRNTEMVDFFFEEHQVVYYCQEKNYKQAWENGRLADLEARDDPRNANKHHAMVTPSRSVVTTAF